MIVSKHVVNIYLMQSPNQNLPLSKEEGIWKRKIGNNSIIGEVL
jgi:hypothetical protein